MAGRIDNPRRPIAPELILCWNEDRCAPSDSTLQRLVYVCYVNENDHGRAAIATRCATSDHVRELGLNYQERIADSHCYVNWRAIRARSPYLLNGSNAAAQKFISASGLWQTNMGNTACTPSGIDLTVTIALPPEPV